MSAEARHICVKLQPVSDEGLMLDATRKIHDPGFELTPSN
jgi:hypothetical protein